MITTIGYLATCTDYEFHQHDISGLIIGFTWYNFQVTNKDYISLRKITESSIFLSPEHEIPMISKLKFKFALYNANYLSQNMIAKLLTLLMNPLLQKWYLQTYQLNQQGQPRCILWKTSKPLSTIRCCSCAQIQGTKKPYFPIKNNRLPCHNIIDFPIIILFWLKKCKTMDFHAIKYDSSIHSLIFDI